MSKAYFSGSKHWAIILGGSSGIGLASAKKLAAEGMHLVVIHRDRKKDLVRIEADCEAIREEGVQVLRFNVDATRLDKMEELGQRIQTSLGEGKVKLLLHSIAKGNLKPLINLPDREKLKPELRRQDFHLTIEAMAISLADWVKMLQGRSLFAEDARVIGLTSHGNQRAIPYYAALSAAKTALEAICRSIALEYAPYGIRCNVIQAGVTDTPSLRMIPASDQLKKYAQMHNPFGRLTHPEDVANVVYLLCRKESSWINGAIIPVDGGERIV